MPPLGHRTVAPAWAALVARPRKGMIARLAQRPSLALGCERSCEGPLHWSCLLTLAGLAITGIGLIRIELAGLICLVIAPSPTLKQ